MTRMLAVCGLLTFSGSLSADDIADLVARAERTTRPNEDKQPPRSKRDRGEIIDLNLDYVELKAGDIANIAKCGKLESLSLIGTTVSDDQLKLLVVLKNLRSVRLNETAVGDAGLKHLGQIKSLKYACLGGVDATPDGVKQLKRDLPDLQVGYIQRKKD